MGKTSPFEYYLRFLILLGFGFWFIYLWFTGNLDLYIHQRFHGLTLAAAAVMFLLAVIERYNTTAAEEGELVSDEACGCCGGAHELHHSSPEEDADESTSREKENNTRFFFTICNWSTIKKSLTYIVFIIPLLLAFLIPPEALDPSMAEQRGFNVNIGASGANEEDAADGIGESAAGESASLPESEITDGHLQVDPDNYVQVTDELWENPADFSGKELTGKGFLYKESGLEEGRFMLGRYMIFCCIADAIVVGFIVEPPPEAHVAEDTWVEVTGEINVGTYQGEETAVVEVTDWQEVEEPGNPYVFYY